MCSTTNGEGDDNTVTIASHHLIEAVKHASKTCRLCYHKASRQLVAIMGRGQLGRVPLTPPPCYETSCKPSDPAGGTMNGPTANISSRYSSAGCHTLRDVHLITTPCAAMQGYQVIEVVVEAVTQTSRLTDSSSSVMMRGQRRHSSRVVFRPSVMTSGRALRTSADPHATWNHLLSLLLH